MYNVNYVPQLEDDEMLSEVVTKLPKYILNDSNTDLFVGARIVRVDSETIQYLSPEFGFQTMKLKQSYSEIRRVSKFS